MQRMTLDFPFTKLGLSFLTISFVALCNKTLALTKSASQLERVCLYSPTNSDFQVTFSVRHNGLCEFSQYLIELERIVAIAAFAVSMSFTLIKMKVVSRDVTVSFLLLFTYSTTFPLHFT